MVKIPVLNFVSATGVLSTEAMIVERQHTVSVEFGCIDACRSGKDREVLGFTGFSQP